MGMIYGAYKNLHIVFLDMKYGLLLAGWQYLHQYLFGSCARDQGLNHSTFFFSFIQE